MGRALPLDYTFCSGLRCRKANTCMRWMNRLENQEAFKKRPEKPISVAQFANHNGDCDRGMYIPEDEPKAPASENRGESDE